MNICLIGLPGAGKSTLGRRLANSLDRPFVDSDHEIEQRIGCTIREFFEQQGEDAFRDVEEATITELTGRPGPWVLSTGGGSVLRPGTRLRLHDAAHVVYLCVQPAELAQRLRHDRRRPLLQGVDPLERLQALFDERDAFYRETAHTIIQTSDWRLPALVEHLATSLTA